MSHGSINVDFADKQEEHLIEKLIGFIKCSDWNNVADFISKYGKMTNLMLQGERGFYIANPVCHAVIRSNNLQMAYFFMKDVDFDSSDDGLIVSAIDTGNLELVRFVISIVPTVEKRKMLEYAKITNNIKIYHLIDLSI